MACQDRQPVIDGSRVLVQGCLALKTDLLLFQNMTPERFLDAANLLLEPKGFIALTVTKWQLELLDQIKVIELGRRWICHIKQKPLWRQRNDVTQNTS